MDNGLSNFQPFGSLRRSTQERRALAKTLIPASFSYQDKGVSVLYLRDHRDANDELAGLLETKQASRSEYVVGFDVEWSPNARHSENAIALIQIATFERVLLIHLSAMTVFPKKLVEFLEDKTVIKAGVGILCDAQRVYKDFGINVKSCVELSYLARALDEEQWSGPPLDLIALTRLVRVYMGHELAKRGKLQMSDWDSELTLEQIEYAANDAHASISVAVILIERAAGRVDLPRFLFDVVHAKAVCVDTSRILTHLLLPFTAEKTRKTTRLRCSESPSKLEALKGRNVHTCTPNSSHTSANGGHARLRDRNTEMWEVYIPESAQNEGSSRHPASTGWRWSDLFSLIWK